MDRREAIRKGLWSVALVPFLPRVATIGHVKEYPTKETRYCPHCEKEVAWKEATMFETTAHDLLNDTRTYTCAGIIIFHIDGTRCQEERIKFEVLEEPIIHVDHQAHRRD